MSLAIARAGLQKVRPQIQSTRLKAALKIVSERSPEAGEYRKDLFIPHYWAVFYHDGRRSLTKPNRRRRGGYFVFYLNAEDDPRLRSNPEARRRPRKLTKAEFYADQRENRRLAALGLPPKMIVTNYIRDLPSHPFFETFTLAREAQEIGKNAFVDYVSKVVPTDESEASTRLL